MSITILKAGIQDTVQDQGRYGYQHLGINIGGVMDRFSATVANLLVGNHEKEAVIELHFPASVFLFQQPALIAVSGAGFSPAINGEPVPLNQPLFINKHSILQFQRKINGARAYLAVQGGLKLTPWLGSNSTHTKAEAGGFEGRSLKKDDEIPFKLNGKEAVRKEPFIVYPWKAATAWEVNKTDEVLVLNGHEWNRLTASAQQLFLNEPFTVSGLADRMGYRLKGEPLSVQGHEELVSSGVSFGTIQLLPEGQLIVLMTDHQPTGGYPRIAHIISAHHGRLAQLHTGDTIKFKCTTLPVAEALLVQQQQHLLQLQNACTLKLKEYGYGA